VTIVVARTEAPPVAPGDAGRGYAGFATRVIAFALDAAIINVVAWFVAIVVALGFSLFDLPHDVKVVLGAIGAGLALVWTVGYFTFFWSTTGQTPGSRVMRTEVCAARTGETLRARRALARVLLLPLSLIPLGAGVLLILVERRRRALHDCLAGSVVTYAREGAPGAPRRSVPFE